MPRLGDPIPIGGRTAPSRVVFGPHETNLCRGRAISDRHIGYYRERAAGGTGVLVTETASVHPSDWPYERAPLAEQCGPGWTAVADACRPWRTLVLAGVGHGGGQGSSAYSQAVLWAPSRVADASSRELPAEMTTEEIGSVVEGFAEAARLAIESGLGGVEVDAGAVALLRQFHSGITNLRTDPYGLDRLRFTGEVLRAVRSSLGDTGVLALRISCDELAPWAGVTPDQAAEQVDVLADLVDLLTVVRGGPYTASAYRPDSHVEAGFNLELCRRMRTVVDGRAAVVLQGSVVDPDAASGALERGDCDLVEMTRAQIADPGLVELVREGRSHEARPCILCNQACRVRDNRNPLVSCVGEPRSGHETTEADPVGHDDRIASVLVVGAGPAGLECARVLSSRGHRVRVAERSERVGGALELAAAGLGSRRLAHLADWLAAACERQGVVVQTGVTITTDDLDRARSEGLVAVVATGSRPVPSPVRTDGSCRIIDALSLCAAATRSSTAATDLEGPVLVHDPIGGPIGVRVAEWLAVGCSEVGIVTQDQVVGTQLSSTGDLADANTRLQRAGIRRHLRAILRGVHQGEAVLQDVWTGERSTVACATIIDCGHRLPEDTLLRGRHQLLRAGDCVAPRTILHAVLEGRRAALAIAGGVTDLANPLVGAAAP